MIAGALASDIGWSAKLNIAGCCRSGTLRVGEAKKPGPRRPRPQRNTSLEMMPQQLFASIALGEKCWRAFYDWASETVKAKEPLLLFMEVPLFLAHAIRRFGDVLFRSGGALLYYRHLVLAAQQKVPHLKQYAHICWDLAGRWELAEPTKHRIPVPLPFMRALVSLAMQLKWRRWAGVVMIAFAGIARVGEILQCQRRHLVLPPDLLDTQSNVAFLVLEQSKTSRRQGPRVQHLKIVDSYIVWLLERIFGSFEKDTFLFAGSPSSFRTRWNHLCSLLAVPPSCGLTPGGLRGGGAVESYRRGLPISEIQWRMRLKNQQTLESYLQEVAALSALTEMPVHLDVTGVCNNALGLVELPASRCSSPVRPVTVGQCFAAVGRAGLVTLRLGGLRTPSTSF